jgi:hypothetical protein
MASDIASQTLSGWPSVTDSDVNKNLDNFNSYTINYSRRIYFAKNSGKGKEKYVMIVLLIILGFNAKLTIDPGQFL